MCTPRVRGISASAELAAYRRPPAPVPAPAPGPPVAVPPSNEDFRSRQTYSISWLFGIPLCRLDQGWLAGVLESEREVVHEVRTVLVEKHILYASTMTFVDARWLLGIMLLFWHRSSKGGTLRSLARSVSSSMLGRYYFRLCYIGSADRAAVETEVQLEELKNIEKPSHPTRGEGLG